MGKQRHNGRPGWKTWKVELGDVGDPGGIRPYGRGVRAHTRSAGNRWKAGSFVSPPIDQPGAAAAAETVSLEMLDGGMSDRWAIPEEEGPGAVAGTEERSLI